MSVGLSALVSTIERRLRSQGASLPPTAFLLGNERRALIAALQQRLLERVGAYHWDAFYRLCPVLCGQGLDGLRAAVALSLPAAVASGVTGEVLSTLDGAGPPPPHSVAFRRLTRATAGHVVFPTQLLVLAEREFGVTALEMTALLRRHTPAAVRAMLLARLIRSRPQMESGARQILVAWATRHLGRLLAEGDAARHTALLLRLAYHRVYHPAVAREVLRRLRLVDFSAPRAVARARRLRPAGR